MTTQYTFTESEHIALVRLLIKLDIFDKRNFFWTYNPGLSGTRYAEIEPPTLSLWLSDSKSNSIY